MFSRRAFLSTSASIGATGLLGNITPAWAKPARVGNLGIPALTGTKFDLDIGPVPVRINGRAGKALGINGSSPAPLIRFREGDEIALNVKNTLDVDSSIHWHGLLVPFQMDGVPGVTFPGIKPGETFPYKFSVPQSGTYWYHSHSGLQEQSGLYGPIIIDPKDSDPIAYDREYVLILSDWTFQDPHRIFSKLKKNAESLNFNKTVMGETAPDQLMWDMMRMSPRDIADVTGETYTYVINGHSTLDNFDMVFAQGERVRLRVINAAAMTLFNIRVPGLPMTVVAADGLNVKPIETDEFQIGVAETYDVILEPRGEAPFAFVAEAIDRSGQVVATLAPRAGMRAQAPKLRDVPMLEMRDMGMNHGDMDSMEKGKTDHSTMNHGKMGHTEMEKMTKPSMPMGPNPHGPSVQLAKTEAIIKRGVGIVNVVADPLSRLDEPGIGLENMPHRVLRYSQLRSLEPNPDKRAPERELVVHLTSNMERYMWSFDGVKFSEVKESIKFYEGERLRMTLVNNTMMPHPIHLHGMFFDVVNGADTDKPRKHTIIVKPAEAVSVDITAEHVGDWAFHCHLLYHMHAGMMQVVSLLPKTLRPASISMPAMSGMP